MKHPSITFWCSILLILLTPRVALAAATAEDIAAGSDGDSAKPTETAKKRPELNFYGTLTLDSAYDDSRVNQGNFARWVESESILPDDSQFSMTANPTRVGLLIQASPAKATTVGGRIEVDFFGGGAENKSNPMLRHAYVSFAWPQKNLSVIAGQTSDIISPLVVPTVNYSAGWWQGNIGYRRAQIRVTKAFDLTPATKLEFQIGPARTITDTTFVSGTIDSGADAAVPTIQSRTSLTVATSTGRGGTVGLSAHRGKEDQHITDPMGVIIGHLDIDSWSVNVDVSVPVTKALLIQGEWFRGSNLRAYLGGIGQQGDIAAAGGWLAVSIDLGEAWRVHLGGGIDDPRDDDLLTLDALARNRMVFVNARRRLTSGLTAALEVMHLRTHYLGQAPGDALREQLSVRYTF